MHDGGSADFPEMSDIKENTVVVEQAIQKADLVSRSRGLLKQGVSWTYATMTLDMAQKFSKLTEQFTADLQAVWQDEMSKNGCDFGLEGAKFRRKKNPAKRPLVSRQAANAFVGKASSSGSGTVDGYKKRRSPSSSNPDFKKQKGPGRPRTVKPGISLSRAQQQLAGEKRKRMAEKEAIQEPPKRRQPK
jgi:hypothetical protein